VAQANVVSAGRFRQPQTGGAGAFEQRGRPAKRAAERTSKPPPAWSGSTTGLLGLLNW